MNETLHRLKKIFKNAYNSKLSPFYRDLYRSKNFTPPNNFPKTQKEWQTLPTISNDYLRECSFGQRLFVPWSEVLSIRISSGTSGKGLTINPRSEIEQIRPSLTPIYETRYMNRFVNFSQGSAYHFMFLKAAFIGVDFEDLPGAARMAALFDIDAIYITPSMLSVFIPHLIRSFDPKKIRLIAFESEILSRRQYDLFRKIFPNARLSGDFGLTQIYNPGYTCEKLWQNKPNLYHPTPDILWELMEIGGNKVIETTEETGEIIITKVFDGAGTPLFRYRTGDCAQRVKTPCGCDIETYELLGRAEIDYVSIPGGGRLWRTEIERVVDLYEDEVEDDYEVRVSETFDSDRLVLKLELAVRPYHQPLDLSLFGRKIEEKLRIGPNRLLTSAIKKKLCEPLSCVLLSKNTRIDGRKKLRIVRVGN